MKKKYFFILLLPVTSYFQTKAQSSLSDSLAQADSVSLQQLINIRSSGISSELEKEVNSSVAAASKTPLSMRKSPSIISILSEDEIAKSGARNLLDLLRHVPGLDFGMDVVGTVAISIRGNFATEGKVLLLIDGVEMNELMYGTTQLTNRVPVELIKRIEVIRGPGSAIYGGFAEYGVINIITKIQDAKGVQASVTYGQQEEGMARQNVSIVGGYKHKNWQITGAAWGGKVQQGSGQFVDFYGNSFDMKNQNVFSPKALNLRFVYKTLSISGFIENYEGKSRDAYDIVLARPYQNNFKSMNVDIKYQLPLSPKLQLDTRLTYNHQKPWEQPKEVDTLDDYFIYTRTISRTKANATLNYDVSHRINFISGVEYFYDNAKTNESSGTFYNGLYKLTYYNVAAFAQSLFKYRWANITAGARFDKHSQAGSAFAPRLGITKKYRNWHGKLLYGNSFRVPCVENINVSENGSIKPEKSTVIELEVGYQLTDDALITASVFDIHTKRPIIYITDGILEYYKNVSAMGTQGIDAEYRYKSSWGFVVANYSYYSNANKAIVGIYDVREQKGANLMAAQHKFNILTSINLTEKVTLSPSVNFLGKRYGYAPFDNSGLGELKSFKSSALCNISIKYTDLLVKGLSATLGGYNLLDAYNPLIANYYSNGGHAPMPNNPREVMLRLIYQY